MRTNRSPADGTTAANSVVIAQRVFWDRAVPVALGPQDRAQHVLILGKTGTGKTTLAHSIVAQDIDAGRGVGVLDPHGDLARALLACIPPARVRDTIYLDPADPDWSVGLNPLGQSRAPRHVTVAGIVSAMRGIWHDSWGPRMEYILANALAALCECPNVSLLGVPRMLVDPAYRQWVVRHVRDPLVRQFWAEEFDRYDHRFRTEAIAPIQNKVGQLLLAEPLRHALGQTRRRLRFDLVMDRGQILLADLAKGRLGDTGSSLLGSLLLADFHAAALRRADLPEPSRRPFTLVVDEFPTFGTENLGWMLAECRKYGLALVLLCQHLSGIPDGVRSAVIGNVGSIIAFRVGHEDARLLEQEFEGQFTTRALASLANFDAVAKLVVDGSHGDPFLIQLPPTPRTRRHRGERVRRFTRERFGTRTRTVRDRIRRWMTRTSQ